VDRRGDEETVEKEEEKEKKKMKERKWSV